jgi:MarR family transcriptional regulator, organic hydroperoxide resistance regulator
MYSICVDDLEREINANVGFLVWRLATEWRTALDRALEPMGLTQAQYSVLAPLHGMCRRGARPSQRQLADLTGLDAVYVSKLIRSLERAGFVERATSAADSRAVELSVTSNGLAVMREASQAVSGIRQRLTEPLGGTAGARTAELAKMLRELLSAPELKRD